MAIAHLFGIYGETLFDLSLPCLEEVAERDRQLFLAMMERRINSPLTSSCGRLFDTVAAMLDVRRRTTYEGQAALELEALAEEWQPDMAYPYAIITTANVLVFDPRLMLRGVIADLAAEVPRQAIARRFHETVARATVDVCEKLRPAEDVNQVVLSGGVFQNRLLTEGIVGGLAEKGFEVFTHRLVPPNDGGLALGQAVIAGNTAS